MRNPLESLDELILNKVFEPITQYAHKKLGWTKYDLVNFTISSASAGYAGAAFYQGIRYVQQGSATDLLLAGVGATLSFVLWNVKKTLAKNEEREIKLAQKGLILPPTINSYRPLLLLYGISMASKGGMGIALENDPSKEINYFIQTSLGFGLILVESSSYFKDTTFFPPGAEKKKLFKSLYESI